MSKRKNKLGFWDKKLTWRIVFNDLVDFLGNTLMVLALYVIVSVGNINILVNYLVDYTSSVEWGGFALNQLFITALFTIIVIFVISLGDRE